MSKPVVLMTAPMHASVEAALRDHVTLHRLWEQDNSEAFLAAHGGEVAGVATSTLYGSTGEALFARLPALRIVASFGVGYDNVDAVAASKRGIVVTNTPGVLDDEVADLAVALLLATVRRLPQADRFVRDGRWQDGAFSLSPTLRARRIGILGLGAIGKAIARRLDGFDVAIAYHGRHRQEGVAYPWHPTPRALAEACDVLVAILPGGAGTRHIVDEAVLRALGPDGVFVNVARGSVVDQAALIRVLEEGALLAAGLDVFADEPEVPAALLALPNVVVLPHVGSATEYTRAAMGRLVAENLLAFFGTGWALTPVPETR
jgi:lactate dehydrogenase-like 2-hydroxyacid dehydrogenase